MSTVPRPPRLSSERRAPGPGFRVFGVALGVVVFVLGFIATLVALFLVSPGDGASAYSPVAQVAQVLLTMGGAGGGFAAIALAIERKRHAIAVALLSLAALGIWWWLIHWAGESTA